jgi:hypothetical protein
MVSFKLKQSFIQNSLIGRARTVIPSLPSMDV